MYADYPELPEGFDEAVQKLVAFFKQYQPVLDQLTATPVSELTPEELDLAIKLASMLEPLMMVQNLLGQQMLYHATAVFHRIEQLAREGNEQAQQAYEKLLPSYRQALKEDLDNAAN